MGNGKAKRVPRLSPIEQIIYSMRESEKDLKKIADVLAKRFGRPFNTHQVSGYMAKLKYSLRHGARH